MSKMESKDALVVTIAVVCFFAVSVVAWISLSQRVVSLEEKEEPWCEITTQLENPDFYSKSPKDGLMEALEYYDIPHKDIVYAQAVLETGYFNSNNCIKKNNLFGLYNSKSKRYMSFSHWVNSVELYKKCFSNRYTNPREDYYHFLRRIHYAEDPNYCQKVKSIRQKLNE